MKHNNSSSSEKINFGESDLLAELAGEATQKIKAVESEEAAHQARSASLHAALQRIFKYLNQFTSHVNKIQPSIPRAYGLNIQLVYDALQWTDGFTDYRKQSFADNAFLDHVLLRIGLINTAPIMLKRRWHQIGILKKELHVTGLRPISDIDTIVRDNPQKEFLHVELKPDFQISMHFQGNYDTGAIDLLCTNIEDFGISSFTLTPEEVSPQFLDELGRFLIGRKNDIPELLNRNRRIAQPPVSR